jgi:hypothetical protein
LTSLDGLENLTSIGGSLQLFYNDTLINILALENLDAGSITNIDIFGNPYLIDCEVQCICDYLSNPTGVVNIHNNGVGCNSTIEASIACGIISPCLPYGDYYISSQADIDNFQTIYPNCTDLNGNMTIEGNNITNLSGINMVNSVSNSLTIEDCDSLINLVGLENLHSIGDEFIIKFNDALVNLTGLEGLSFIPHYFDIEYNGLTSMSGLENVNSLGGSLYIYANSALTDLMGLHNIQSIGGFLYIELNYSLVSLSGLDSIHAGSISNLGISGNPSLSTCEVQSVCDYLASPNGIIEIHDNASGCDSQQEVQAACEVGLDESSVVSRQSSVSIYPNPSSNLITIELLSNKPIRNTFLTIYNLNGQALSSYHLFDKQTVVDVSALPKGIYLVKVKDDKTVEVGKFVKQ